MTKSARAVISMAALTVATPVIACPGMYACIPTACYDMHGGPISTPSPLQTGPFAPDSVSKNITLLSQVSLTQLGGGAGSSLYAWVDPLTRREYAIMGRTAGTSFVDVTNPTNPIVVANLPRVSGSAATSWREPKVYQNTVYIGVDGTSVGMQVMDLTKLRDYAGTTMTLTHDSVYRPTQGASTLNRIHTLAINHDTGYLYAAGTNFNGGRLHMIDVRNPSAPVSAGTFPTSIDGYTHETQVVIYNGPDQQYRGREIAFNNNGSLNFSIVDVTNKSAPTKIASRTYTGARYIHQGWLTEDHRFVFQNDELDEPGVTPRTRTHLWDVSNLSNPVYKGFWDNVTASVDHNLYVKGDYVYQSNYTTGLRILKIGDLENGHPSQWLTEVAFYDTYLPNDGSSFNGAWNNYPFLPSGNILVSDINGGLFVLRADLPGEGGPLDPRIGIPRGGWGGSTQLVPEPASAALFGFAAAALLVRRRQR